MNACITTESIINAFLSFFSEVEAPHGLSVSSKTGNLTVCWSTPPDGLPDGYNVTSQPLIPSLLTSLSSLWVNRSSPAALWLNNSVCVTLGPVTPGQTNEVGVVSVMGKDRSQETSLIHTASKRNKNNTDLLPFKSRLQLSYLSLSSSFSLLIDPLPVQVAIPVSVGTDSAKLFIQHPQLGLTDGVKVCVCPGECDRACEGLCEHTCDWYPLPAGVHNSHIITLNNLSPGFEYQLRVYSTSKEQVGPPYYSQIIRTGKSYCYLTANL